MSSIALKILCSLAGAFGAATILFAWFAYSQGLLSSYDAGTVSLKIVGTVVRSAFLLLCAWAAWRQPHNAALYALAAFLAFVIGGAADEVYRRGLVGGFGNLIPTYYFTSAIHGLFALAVWRLAPKAAAVAVG